MPFPKSIFSEHYKREASDEVRRDKQHIVYLQRRCRGLKGYNTRLEKVVLKIVK